MKRLMTSALESKDASKTEALEMTEALRQAKAALEQQITLLKNQLENEKGLQASANESLAALEASLASATDLMKPMVELQISNNQMVISQLSLQIEFTSNLINDQEARALRGNDAVAIAEELEHQRDQLTFAISSQEAALNDTETMHQKIEAAKRQECEDVIAEFQEAIDNLTASITEAQTQHDTLAAYDGDAWKEGCEGYDGGNADTRFANQVLNVSECMRRMAGTWEAFNGLEPRDLCTDVLMKENCASVCYEKCSPLASASNASLLDLSQIAKDDGHPLLEKVEKARARHQNSSRRRRHQEHHD
jgi:hypothetical protein